ncbi:MAG: CHASE2 domain-containing protein [Geminicoccaceae bacterium]
MASGAMGQWTERLPGIDSIDWTRHAGRPAAAMVSALLLALWLWNPDPVRLAREHVFDLYQQILPREPQEVQVVVVEIDEESLRREGQWPWPRAKLAQLVDRIAAAGARMIGIDMIFAETDRHSPENAVRDWRIEDPRLREALADWIDSRPTNDTILAESLRFAPPSVVGTLGVDPKLDFTPPAASSLNESSKPAPSILSQKLENHLAAIAILPTLQEAAKSAALTNITPDSDGTVRRTPLLYWVEESVRPAFALEAFRLGLGARSFALAGNDDGVNAIRLVPHGVEIATDVDGSIRPYFSRPDRTARALDPDMPPRSLMASGLLDSPRTMETLRNRWVLVGLSDPLLAADWPTPPGDRLPGIMLQAELLENLVEVSWLRRPAWAPWLEFVIGCTLAFALVLLVPRIPMIRATAIMAAAGVSLPLTGFLVFRSTHILLDGVLPALTGLAAFAVLTSAGYAIATRQRRALDAELLAARRVQRSMLPTASELQAFSGRLDVAAHLESARTVGGDFYDCVKLGENRVLLAVADVSGKGIDAALFMALAKSLIHSMARRLEHPTAGAILGESAREIDSSQHADMFVATACILVDLASMRMDVARAGHPPPVLLRDRQAQVLHDPPPGLPLGLDRAETYENTRIDLRPGDVVLMATDGVLESFDDGKGRSIERFADIVHGAASSGNARELLDHVRARMSERSSGLPADDRTLLAFSVPHEAVSGATER